MLSLDKFTRSRDQDLRIWTLLAMSSSAGERKRSAATVAALRSEQASTWLDFAERNGVGPIVAKALLDRGELHDDHRQRAKQIYETSQGRMRILMDELDRISQKLDLEGIPLIGLKNAGIARGIIDDPAICPMGDIDTLVRKTQFHDAHRIVEEAGYRLKTRGHVEAEDLDSGFESGGTEYFLKVGPETVWLELQWRAVAGRWIPKGQEPDGEALVDRSCSIPGTKLRLLCPVDNMVQVALHTAKHSYVRAPGLRLHTDVDRLANFYQPDWNEVAAAVEVLGTRTATYLSLLFARVLLNSPVPDSVLDRLRPSSLRERALVEWVCKADVFEPDEPKFSRPEMIGFHALLYDDPRSFLASLTDSSRDELSIVNAPRLVGRASKRAFDLLTRYQR